MVASKVVGNSIRWDAELARRACEASGLEQFRADVLAVCRQAVPYDTAVLTEYRRHEPVASVDIDVGMLQLIRHCEQNLLHYAADLKKCFAAARRAGGFVDVDVYSFRERHELPLYCEIVRPQGIRSSIGLTPRWRGVMLGMIRLERHGGPPFTDADLRKALALLPIIELGLAAHDPTLGGASDIGCDRLTDREAEVAHHAARGLTSRHIALLLGTSPFTVRNQLCRIFDKLGLGSRAELAAWLARRDTHGADVPFRIIQSAS